MKKTIRCAGALATLLLSPTLAFAGSELFPGISTGIPMGAPLLQYLVRTIGEASERTAEDRAGHQLDEFVCIEVLRSWAASAGIGLEAGGAGAAPYYVRAAEAFMRRPAFAIPLRSRRSPPPSASACAPCPAAFAGSGDRRRAGS